MVGQEIRRTPPRLSIMQLYRYNTAYMEMETERGGFPTIKGFLAFVEADQKRPNQK